MPITVKTPDGATITFPDDVSPERARELTKAMMFPIRYGVPLTESSFSRQIQEVESQKNQYGDK